VVVLRAGTAAVGMVVAEETVAVAAADKAAANDSDLTLIHPSAWKRDSPKYALGVGKVRTQPYDERSTRREGRDRWPST
jgi:hypothetical protein